MVVLLRGFGAWGRNGSWMVVLLWRPGAATGLEARGRHRPGPPQTRGATDPGRRNGSWMVVLLRGFGAWGRNGSWMVALLRGRPKNHGRDDLAVAS